MTNKGTQCERHCDPERHDQHLCYMIALGLNVTDEQDYQNLIAEAHFRCGHCGRTARNEENLCVPARL